MNTSSGALQRLGHVAGDRHAAARQSEDDHVVAFAERFGEGAPELAPGIVPIAERQHESMVRKECA